MVIRKRVQVNQAKPSGDRLTFAGDAVFQVGFESPTVAPTKTCWCVNPFSHQASANSKEAAPVRVALLRELAQSRESLVTARA